MGLFKKKEKSEEIKLPELPRLPELPKLPEIKKEKPEKFIHQLPRFPNGSIGEKFSQNTIKEAVKGKGGEEVFADEFAREDELQMMHKPRIKEMPEEFPYQKRVTRMIPQFPQPPQGESFKGLGVEEKKPLFVRIDKIEESLNALQNASRLVFEIGKLLQDIKRIKEEEGKELESWERQIQAAKMEIERINRNIFSKIE